jgi:site-specific recombinase XerD/ribosomal protein L40E
MYTLITIAIILKKEFEYTDKDDIINLMNHINNNTNYSEWTIKDYKVTLKKYYRWLRKTEDYPEEVKFLKTTVKKSDKKLPESLLTIDEIKKLTNTANNIRDKAILLTLYESGARVGEFLPVKIKHIQFDQYGALMMLHGKTGSRRIRLIASSPMLAKWLSVHPDRENQEAYVWAGQSNTNQGMMLSYIGLRRLLDKLARKTNIQKRMNPHSFRHARATELAKQLTEAQLCSIFGWEIGSDQPATYVHLSQRDTDDAILSIHGLKEEEIESNQLKIIICNRCKTKNSPDARFCESCGIPLDMKVALEQEKEINNIDDQIAKIFEDENIRNIIINKIQELNIKQ